MEDRQELISEIMQSRQIDDIEINDDLRGTLRYISGATIHSVCKDLKYSQEREVHFSIKTKIKYCSYKIMQSLRISEEALIKQSQDAHSVAVVCARQGAKRALTHVGDDVLNFFIMVYKQIAKIQCLDMMHVCHQDLLKMTKSILYKDSECIMAWFKLFENSKELAECTLFSDDSSQDECDAVSCENNKNECEMDLVDSILLELYNKCICYFCKVHFSELMSRFKEKIGKKKSQPIRTKVTALDIAELEGNGKKTKYPCVVCGKECKSYFTTYDESSVQCSMCSMWFHFPCAGIKGTEKEVQAGNDDDWYCRNCKSQLEIPDKVVKQKRGSKTAKAKTDKQMEEGKCVGRGRGRGRGRGGRGRGKAYAAASQSSVTSSTNISAENFTVQEDANARLRRCILYELSAYNKIFNVSLN